MYRVVCFLLAVHAIILSTGYPVDQMKCKVDIAFVVDSSVSISEKNFDVQKEFIKDVVKRFVVGREDVQFAAVSYSEQVKDEFFFTAYSDKNDIIDAVDRIHHSEGKATRTYIAIARMREQLFGPGKGSRDDAVHVGIIITDGTTNPGSIDRLSANQGKAKTQEEAKLAREDGIYLFAVGVGSKVNKEELQGIASVDPDNKFMITVDSYDELNKEAVKEALSYRACYPSELPQGEDPREVCQGKPADVFFLLDESSSIHTEANFKLELKFVEHVIDYLDVSAELTRIGVLTFSNDANMHFRLNEYPEKDEVQSALKKIQWTGGDTYTNKALQMLRNDGFSAENGARKGVAHIGIIVTDGNSTDPVKTSEEAEKVLSDGTYMFAIGVGFVNKVELNTLASNPDFVFTVDNLGALDKIQEILAYKVCKDNKDETPQEICGQRTADIVFMADASTNIGKSDFGKLLSFIGEVVSQFDIGAEATRVGLITFADTSNIEFNLNSYESLTDMKKAISNVEWRSGQRQTAKAIQTMYCEMFTPEQGARGDDIPKIGIVFSDGNSRQPKKTSQMSKAAHDLGIHIFAIGVGPYIAEDELKSLSSNLDSYFKVNDFSELNSIRQALTLKVCREAKPQQLHQPGRLDKKRLKEIERLLDMLEKTEDLN